MWEPSQPIFSWSLCVMALSSMGWCQGLLAGEGNAVTVRCMVGAGAALLVPSKACWPNWPVRCGLMGRGSRECDARGPRDSPPAPRSEEHTSELQSRLHLVCRLLLEKKKKNKMLSISSKKTIKIDN